MNQVPFVEDIETYAQDIVDTVREPLLMLDTNLRVQSANRAFYETFHVSSAETENQLIYELGNGQWDIPDLRTLLEDVIPTSSVFNDFELEHTFPIIGRRVMLLNGRKLRALDVVENGACVRQPGLAQHRQDNEGRRSARERTPSSTPCTTSAAGTMSSDPRIPNRSPRTPAL